MGSRRLGARRINALLGETLAEDNTNLPGKGAKDFVVRNVVTRRGTEVVTEITVDLGSSVNVATQPGTVRQIIGVSASAADYVANGDAHHDAYLTRLTPAVNGYIYGCEMICTELPDASIRDIDLLTRNNASHAFSGSTSSHTLILEPGGDFALGGYAASGSFKATAAFTDSGLDNHYVYLAKGSATDGVKRSATTGKFTIRFLGVLACEDK